MKISKRRSWSRSPLLRRGRKRIIPFIASLAAIGGCSFLWVILFPAQRSATASALAAPDAPAAPEDTRKRILLGSGLPKLPEPQRPCRSGRDLPKLMALQEWISAKQRPRESITLMTQLSADR